MPVNKYFAGHGDEVMGNMTKEYGPEKGKRVFYATANKRGAKPMADGGMVVPDDPYYRDPRRTAGLPMVPDVPSNIPEPPPVAQAPPDIPPSYAPQLNQSGYTGTPDIGLRQPPQQMSLAENGSLGGPPDIGVAGARADIPGAGDPQAAKVDAKTADSVTQNTPAATSDAYGAGSDNPGSAPSSPETPPDVPPTIGKTTGYDLGPPKVTTPMTDQAIAYGKQVLMDPKHPGQFKKPAAWQNILGGVLAASPKLRHIDLHPTLTSQYQNYKMMTNMANEERLAQVAGAQEQSHRAQVMASLARANRDATRTDKVGQYKEMQRAKEDELIRNGVERGSPEWKHAMSGYNVPASVQMADSLSPETINRAAERLLFFQEPPQGGRGGTGFILRVHEAAAKMAQERGISVSQQELWGMQKKADLADLTKLQGTRDQMMAFEDTASKNLDIALANSHRNGRTGSPIINEYLQWGQGKLLGNDDIALFNNSIETAANEYAKVTTGMTSGVLSDAARLQAKSMLDKSLADGTFTKVVAQMKKEMENRRNGYDKQIGEIRQRTLGRQDEVPAPRAGTPLPANAPLPPGPTLEQRGPAPAPKGPLPTPPSATSELAPPVAAPAAPAIAPGVAAPGPRIPSPSDVIVNGVRFPNQEAANRAIAAWKAQQAKGK